MGSFLKGQDGNTSGYLVFGDYTELSKKVFEARGFHWGSKLEMEEDKTEDSESIYEPRCDVSLQTSPAGPFGNKQACVRLDGAL